MNENELQSPSSSIEWNPEFLDLFKLRGEIEVLKIEIKAIREQLAKLSWDS